jgi:hypothetical protein
MLTSEQCNVGFDPGTSCIETTSLPTELKEISTNAVSRGGYEPTTVPIALGRGAFPLHLVQFFYQQFKF